MLPGPLIEVVFPQPPVQLRARQAETFGCLRLIPAALAHHSFDGLPLHGV
jgi:hypothetical protein